MKKRLTLLLLALAFIAGNAQAAKWYVDNAVAASGNGQSRGKAFRQFSDIVWPNVHAGDVSYSPNDANNYLHLAPTDKAAKDAGVSLSSYFTTDKDGITHPQGSAWDIGAYEQ